MSNIGPPIAEQRTNLRCEVHTHCSSPDGFSSVVSRDGFAETRAEPDLSAGRKADAIRQTGLAPRTRTRAHDSRKGTRPLGKLCRAKLLPQNAIFDRNTLATDACGSSIANAALGENAIFRLNRFWQSRLPPISHRSAWEQNLRVGTPLRLRNALSRIEAHQ